MVYYAVANGRNIGLYNNWTDCNKQVYKFSNAIYKKFNTKEESTTFITNNRVHVKSPIKLITNNRVHVKSPINAIQAYYVYTDGSCHNNGKANAIAGIGIYFGVKDKRNVSKRINGKQTNNTAELKAIIETYNIIKYDIESGKNITIVSDSKYAISCATTYGEKCSKTNYMKKGVFIPNKELVRQIYETYKNINNVRFMHCKAHTNKTDIHSVGNDGADNLANKSYNLKNIISI